MLRVIHKALNKINSYIYRSLKLFFGKKSLEKETSSKFETKVNSVSNFDYHIIRNKNLRILGIASSFMFIFLFIFSIFPVINSQDKAEAAPGDTPNSLVNLTMTVGKEAASVDLIPNNANGTFASSDTTSGNSVTAEFTVTTTNYTGYNLQITANDDNGLLVNSNTSDSLSSIAAATSEADFSADTAAAGSSYNGKWGYKPSIFNSAANTNYLPSPTTTATTLNNTTAKNGSDTTCDNPLNTTCATHKYTIALGARTDYTKPSGTYTNSYTLTAVANYVAYAIEYYDLDYGTNTATDANISWTDPDTGTTAKKATFKQIASPQASSITDTASPATVTLNPNYTSGSAPTRDTYTFAGWCRKTNDHGNIGVNQTVTAMDSNGIRAANATTKVTAYNNPATMCNGVVPDYNTSTDDFIKAGDTTLKIDPTIDNNAATNPIKLYAVWKPTTFANAGIAANANMQTMTSAICAATTPNQFTTLKDSRDSVSYTIIKMLDGHCWMADNLDFDAYYYRNSISTSNTNISSGTTYTNVLNRFKSGTGYSTTDQYASASINSSNSASYTDPSPSSHSTMDWTTSYSYSVPMANRHGSCNGSSTGSYPCAGTYKTASYTHTKLINYMDGDTTKTYNFGPGKYQIGTYYNYCAATVGYFCWGNGTSAGSPTQTQGTNITGMDICPAGWKLPRGDQADGSFYNLYSKVGNITSAANTATDPLSLQVMLSTPVSGHYRSGTAYRQGTYGYFWSSTYYSGTDMYGMGVAGAAVNPQSNYSRDSGYSVRCIAQ